MLETEAVTVTVEFTTPCVTQIVTVCDPGNVKQEQCVFRLRCFRILCLSSIMLEL